MLCKQPYPGQGPALPPHSFGPLPNHLPPPCLGHSKSHSTQLSKEQSPFLTSLFPAGQRSKGVSWVAVPVLGLNGSSLPVSTEVGRSDCQEGGGPLRGRKSRRAQSHPGSSTGRRNVHAMGQWVGLPISGLLQSMGHRQNCSGPLCCRAFLFGGDMG